jgi:hypothetical protein
MRSPCAKQRVMANLADEFKDRDYLSNFHLNSFLSLLLNKFPETKGLIDPNLTELKSYLLSHNTTNSSFVYCVDADSKSPHWVLASNLRSNDDSWILYDSLNTPASKLLLLIRILCPNCDSVIIKREFVSKQTNGYDCGLYVLAFAYILASGDDPKEFHLEQQRMRGHFRSCLKFGQARPFPAQRRLKRLRDKQDLFHLELTKLN